MDFFDVYVNIIRAFLVAVFVFYLYTHNFKLAKTTIVTFVLTFLVAVLERLFNLKIDSVRKFFVYNHCIYGIISWRRA